MFGLRHRILASCVLGLSFLSFSPTLSAAEGPAMPKVVDPGSPEVMAILEIPNLNTLCDHAEALGKTFDADHVKPGMLKAMLSQKFSEPLIASIDSSKPIVAMLLMAHPESVPEGKKDPVIVTVFVPASTDAPFAEFAKNAKGQIAYQDGIVMLAETAGGIDQAKGQLALYKKIQGDPLSTDARLMVNAAGANQLFGPILQMLAFAGLEKMKAAPPAAGPAPIPPAMLHKVLMLYLKGALGLFNQSQALQLDVSMNADAFKTDFLVQAKPGTTLGNLLAAPAPYAGKTASAVVQGAPMSGYYRMNPAAFAGFSDAMINELNADPELKEFASAEAIAIIKDYSQLMTGEAAFSLSEGKEGSLAITQQIGISDEAKYYSSIQNVAALFKPEAFLGKLYASMGMSFDMTVAKNVRQHAGIEVSSLKTTIQAQLPEKQQDMLKKMPLNYELAFNKGILSMSSSAEGLDALLDKSIAGTVVAEGALPLQSIKEFGPGLSGYFDMDLTGYLKIAAGLDPNPGNPLKIMAPMLKPSTPLTYAMNMADGKMLIKHTFPVGPILQIIQITKQLQPPPPQPGAKGDKPVPPEQF